MPLKMYREKADSSQFWEEHWKRFLQENSLRKFYQSFSSDSVIMKVFETYLPHDGRIIEAGCGLGGYVYFLRQKGYDIEGIDFAKGTVNFVNSEFPQLPVHVGNVFHLDYPDSAVKGYISLGVVEHCEEGPERILKEAYRVIEKGGILILSIPYFNPLRRIKKCFGGYEPGGNFYQWSFTKSEVRNILAKTDFKAIDFYYYDVVKVLKDEISILKPIILKLQEQNKKKREEILRMKSEKNNYLRTNNSALSLLYFLKRFLNSKGLTLFIAHMILVVARVRK